MTRLRPMLLILIAASSQLFAQEARTRTLLISPYDLVSETANVTFSLTSDLHRKVFFPGTSAIFVAPLHLPDGAVVEYLDLEYCKATPSGIAEASVFLSCAGDGGFGFCNGDTFPTAFADEEGCHRAGVAVSHQIDNQYQHILAFLQANNGEGGLTIGPLRIYYHLRAPEGPGVAHFTDVPLSHPFFRFVEALYATGAIAGCGGGKYCPDAPVTRGQLAVILAQSMGLGW